MTITMKGVRVARVVKETLRGLQLRLLARILPASAGVSATFGARHEDDPIFPSCVGQAPTSGTRIQAGILTAGSQACPPPHERASVCVLGLGPPCC